MSVFWHVPYRHSLVTFHVISLPLLFLSKPTLSHLPNRLLGCDDNLVSSFFIPSFEESIFFSFLAHKHGYTKWTTDRMQFIYLWSMNVFDLFCDLSITTVEDCVNLLSYAIPLSLSLPCFYTMYFYLRSQKPRRHECKQTSKRKGYILVAYLNFFSFFFLFSFSLRC